jgi:hypothetical protein
MLQQIETRCSLSENLALDLLRLETIITNILTLVNRTANQLMVQEALSVGVNARPCLQANVHVISGNRSF